jgi:hypothetical protein
MEWELSSKNIWLSRNTNLFEDIVIPFQSALQSWNILNNVPQIKVEKYQRVIEEKVINKGWFLGIIQWS